MATVPLFEGKQRLASIYTPALFLDHLRTMGWEPGTVPRSVINTFARFELFLGSDPESYTPNHMLGTGPGRFFLVNATDQRLAINCLGTGAAVTATQLELQAKLGVERFVHVGTAGGLDPKSAVGDLVIPTSAVRDEGTSLHYAPPEVTATPTEPLTADYRSFLAAQDMPGESGPVWTTGAPFRTTAEEVEHYVRHGVLAVEEEVAALFIVGAAVGVETTAALVLDGVSDGEGGWDLDLARAGQDLRRCLAATVDFLASS